MNKNMKHFFKRAIFNIGENYPFLTEFIVLLTIFLGHEILNLSQGIGYILLIETIGLLLIYKYLFGISVLLEFLRENKFFFKLFPITPLEKFAHLITSLLITLIFIYFEFLFLKDKVVVFINLSILLVLLLKTILKFLVYTFQK